jgi:glycosyltransferase involved in cell wall biosynthesis
MKGRPYYVKTFCSHVLFIRCLYFISLILRANIVHRDLNPCGGGERLSLAVMQAISAMGIDFDITTLEKPNFHRIENSFSIELAAILEKASNINILQSALGKESELSDTERKKISHYDLTINTHGDALPYYSHYFSKKNSIVQCHFPTAKYHIVSENENYLREIGIKPVVKNVIINNNTISTTNTNVYNKKYFQMLKDSYLNLMRNSVVLTNSEFSKKAIAEELEIEARVLSPPVDIERFRNGALTSNEREDIVLVLSRIVPYKKIENAIAVAKILKENKIGKGMKIIGNLYDDDFVISNYYSYLLQMVKECNLEDYISFETSINLEKIIESMRHAKIYLHTMSGESFGISTVEAMSAGLTPVVPHIGGHTEFVPQKYQFDTLEKASEIISSAFNVSYLGRVQMSNSVKKFSISNYTIAFQRLVDSLFN